MYELYTTRYVRVIRFYSLAVSLTRATRSAVSFRRTPDKTQRRCRRFFEILRKDSDARWTIHDDRFPPSSVLSRRSRNTNNDILNSLIVRTRDQSKWNTYDEPGWYNFDFPVGQIRYGHSFERTLILKGEQRLSAGYSVRSVSSVRSNPSLLAACRIISGIAFADQTRKESSIYMDNCIT